jgi:GNAT superfamily N-acetyltransferase
MDQLTVRPARIGEAETLSALQWRASAADPAFENVVREVPEAIRVPEQLVASGSVLVAERGGAIVGFAVVLDHGKDVELEGLFVEPGAWRTGAGRALVDRAADVARRAGVKWLDVIGNPNARGFYEACGFETIETKQLRFGEGLVMRLPL